MTNRKYITHHDMTSGNIKIKDAHLNEDRTKITVNLIHREKEEIRFKAVIKYYLFDRGEWYQSIEFIMNTEISIGGLSRMDIEKALKIVFNDIMMLSRLGEI